MIPRPTQEEYARYCEAVFGPERAAGVRDEVWPTDATALEPGWYGEAAVPEMSDPEVRGLIAVSERYAEAIVRAYPEHAAIVARIRRDPSATLAWVKSFLAPE